MSDNVKSILFAVVLCLGCSLLLTSASAGLKKYQQQNIRIDRQKLKYLNIMEKLNCMYCGYANGLLNYARVISGETERYWCGIKHKSGDGFNEPEHHKDFLEYGDEEGFRAIS